MSNPEPEKRSEAFKASAAQAWELRVKGHKHHQIAVALGIGLEAVAERLTWWRKIGCKEGAEGESLQEFHRDLSLDQLDHYLAMLASRLDGEDDEALKIALKVLDQKAKLLGLNAAVKTTVDQKVTTYVIEGIDPELLR